MEQKHYRTREAAQKLNVSKSAIQKHAKHYNIGQRINKVDYVFNDNDLVKLKQHIGAYGNPHYTKVYREWTLDQYRSFVNTNRLYPREHGYNYSEEEMARRFNVPTRIIRGLRRRHKLAARVSILHKGEINNEYVAYLMKTMTENQLRKYRKDTQPLRSL